MIKLVYGKHQHFQYRHDDINIIGRTDARLPAARSVYRLNSSDESKFYIEPAEKESDPRVYPFGCRTPGCHRLKNLPGFFNIEIPVSSCSLLPGDNELEILVTGADKMLHVRTMTFTWDPDPVLFPVILEDLSDYENIQAVGQVVNGFFRLERNENNIRSVRPVGSDILFLIGSPNRSQEATYSIEFSSLRGMFLGLSDFFSGHIVQAEGLGIKPGYSTSSLATINGRGDVNAWISWGDILKDRKESWVVRTKPGSHVFKVRPRTRYRVRHQVIFEDDFTISQFRIWPESEDEPHSWTCRVDNLGLPAHLPRNKTASFGLFQFFGLPTRWRDIHVRELVMEK